MALCAAQGAVAQRIEGCDAPDQRVLAADITQAKVLTLRAAAAVGDTVQYDRWFGAYAAPAAESVRATLKRVVATLQSGRMVAQCLPARDDGCQNGEYAFVYRSEAYRIYLCPSYFTLPPLTALRPTTAAGEFGTREGTIVHELSHFTSVGPTEDHCYSRSECSAMAAIDAKRAINNADSFQYFVEDITYDARQPVAGKPAP